MQLGHRTDVEAWQVSFRQTRDEDQKPVRPDRQDVGLPSD
jgi:hypothetical protein